MNQTIKYLEISRQPYEDFEKRREDTNRELEGKQIINIETLEDTIRFWYKED